MLVSRSSPRLIQLMYSQLLQLLLEAINRYQLHLTMHMVSHMGTNLNQDMLLLQLTASLRHMVSLQLMVNLLPMASLKLMVSHLHMVNLQPMPHNSLKPLNHSFNSQLPSQHQVTKLLVVQLLSTATKLLNTDFTKTLIIQLLW